MLDNEAKLASLNKAGLVDPPIHPCYRGDGLCQLRRLPDGEFECGQEPKTCRYFRKRKEARGDDGD